VNRFWLGVGILVLIVLVVGATHHGQSSADVRLVKSRSYCQEQPADAQLAFVLTFRNTGSRAESFSDVTPYRRYDDGTVNMSGVDQLSGLKVAARSTKTYFAKFDYDALSHDVLECGLIKSGSSKIISLRVRDPG
jgi:hypothetical protein